jgi:hypothetical protein
MLTTSRPTLPVAPATTIRYPMFTFLFGNKKAGLFLGARLFVFG